MVWSWHSGGFEYARERNEKLQAEVKRRADLQTRMESTLSLLDRDHRKIRGVFGFALPAEPGPAPAREAPGSSYALLAATPSLVQASALVVAQGTLKTRTAGLERNVAGLQSLVDGKREHWKRLPAVSPSRGQWTSGFGYRRHPVTGQMARHEGLDIAASAGTPIHAPAAGKVITSEYSGFYGNLVVLSHGNGYTTKFAHLSRAVVRTGQKVERFALLGYMGGTGRTTGVHLHYEVHHQGRPLNPEKFILPSGTLVD